MNDDTPIPGRPCERTFPLEDISIRADGDGRTVTAYAAVFNTPAEITDQDGHYLETISPGAFSKTLADRARQIQVFYNHGKTLYGTPSERFSLPLGVPEEIKPDGRGLLTVTRFNRTPLADEVLEAIRNGDIRGQSFSGRFIPGRSKRTYGTGGELDTILRSEIALREYGPTPMPSYQEAAIIGVRMDRLIENLGLTEDQRRALLEFLDTSRTIGTPSPADDAAQPGTSSDNDTPAERHLSQPTPSERRQWLLADLKEVA